MEIKEYNYGDGYFPKLFIDGKKIIDAQCKCQWGKVHKNAWKEGDTICEHIKCAIREFNLEVRNGKFKD